MEPVSTNINFETKNLSLRNFIDKALETKSEKNVVNTEDSFEENRAPIGEDKLEDVVKNVNDFFNSNQTDLKIEIHKETNTAVFKIVRRKDHKVIKQIPPEEILELAVNIRKMVGSLHDSNA